MALTDNDPMPWGKFQGVKMQDVPASYLLFLFEGSTNKVSGDVRNYITENIETLRLQKAQRDSKKLK